MVRRTRQSRRGKGVVVLPLLSVGWALWVGREVEACKDGLLMQTATFLLVLDFRLLLLRLLLVPSGVVITSSSLIQLVILLLLLLPPLMLPRESAKTSHNSDRDEGTGGEGGGAMRGIVGLLPF